MGIDLAQLPASAANAALTFFGIISPRRRLRAEIMADKELQRLFEKDSDAYKMLDAKTTIDVAVLTEHLIPANKKKTNWSSAFFGACMLLGFAWWTWRLHETHSGWQWLTGTVAVFGFFGILGSRSPAAVPQPPEAEGDDDAHAPQQTAPADELSSDELPADGGRSPLATRSAS